MYIVNVILKITRIIITLKHNVSLLRYFREFHSDYLNNFSSCQGFKDISEPIKQRKKHSKGKNCKFVKTHSNLYSYEN
jgi:hypothetical protein